MAADPAVVFLSYSHDSEQHRERVLGLSERLRRDGLETRLDQYINGSPTEGWPRWMLNQLDEASYVLVVCTRVYYERFRGHGPERVGKGVNWEGTLITQELYDARSRTVKFVPVLFDGQPSEIPEPLRAHTHYRLSSEQDYTSLCAFLRGVAGVEPAPIGEPEKPVRRRGNPIRFDGAITGVQPADEARRFWWYLARLPLGAALATLVFVWAYSVMIQAMPDPSAVGAFYLIICALMGVGSWLVRGRRGRRGRR